MNPSLKTEKQHHFLALLSVSETTLVTAASVTSDYHNPFLELLPILRILPATAKMETVLATEQAIPLEAVTFPLLQFWQRWTY